MTQTEFIDMWDTVLRGCSYVDYQGVGIYTLPAFSVFTGLKHGFSARTGGVSVGEFASLNLSFSRETPCENVMQNYRIFCDAVGIDKDSMVMDNFAHGTTVQRVNKTDAGRGYTRAPLPSCDALITDDPSITLLTGHADCMAIYMYDPVRRCIGLAHAGWRGALHRIGMHVVSAMQDAYSTQPTDLCVGIGPSICPNCFEVDSDVAEAFTAAFPGTPCVRASTEPGKYTVDLWMVAFRQLIDEGVCADRISLMNVCTYEDERLYSYRRDRGRTGGMAAFLALCTSVAG